MIQKHSTSKSATILKFKINKPKNGNNCVFDTRKQNARNAQWHAFKMKKVSNTAINKLYWRFNQIFLVITNRDFYCMSVFAHHADNTLKLRKRFLPYHTSIHPLLNLQRFTLLAYPGNTGYQSVAISTSSFCCSAVCFSVFPTSDSSCSVIDFTFSAFSVSCNSTNPTSMIPSSMTND